MYSSPNLLLPSLTSLPDGLIDHILEVRLLPKHFRSEHQRWLGNHLWPLPGHLLAWTSALACHGCLPYRQRPDTSLCNDSIWKHSWWLNSLFFALPTKYSTWPDTHFWNLCSFSHPPLCPGPRHSRSYLPASVSPLPWFHNQLQVGDSLNHEGQGYPLQHSGLVAKSRTRLRNLKKKLWHD